MQVMFATINGETEQLMFPAPHVPVLPGVLWGRFDELLTPAYWRGQAWQHSRLGTYSDLRIGQTLAEEIAACLLGGFGMSAELGIAAFRRLRDYGLLEPQVAQDEIETALASPFLIQGKKRKYRFPRQKARYLAACLQQLDTLTAIEDDVALRNLLITLPGIGPKTASWIVRNHMGSNAVAVLDIHIMRAGLHIGLFVSECNLDRHYLELESAFLAFAQALDTPAGMLDGLIWDYMRRLPMWVRQPHR